MIDDGAPKDLMFEAVLSLGRNFFVQGKYEKAQIIFLGLMALAPKQIEPALAYGDALLLEGKAELAKEHFLYTFNNYENDRTPLIGAAKACILLDNTDEAKRLLGIVLQDEQAPSNLKQLARSIEGNC